MSVSDKFRLTVRLNPEFRVTVRNSRDEPIRHYDPGGNRLTDTLVLEDLDKGLYTVQSEHGGQITERLVRLDRVLEIEAPTPPLYSAAPLMGTVSSHEYFTDPAERYSRELTDPDPLPFSRDSDSGLFLFIRSADRPEHRVNPGSGLSLVTEKGRTILNLGTSTSAENRNMGWFAYGAKTDQGTRYLQFKGEATIPIPTFSGWQTQLFLIGHRGQLRLDAMRVFLAFGGLGFYASDGFALAVDRAVTGLVNGRNLLPREQMNILLKGKFDNPMLGILGAWLLFLKPEPDADLIETVIGNLEAMIPGSMDVLALRLKHAQRFNTELPKARFTAPPLFAAGFDALIEASLEDPGLLPAGEFWDRIVLNRRDCGPWLSWTPTGESLDDGWILNDVLTKLSSGNRTLDDARKKRMALELGVGTRHLEPVLDRVMAQREKVRNLERIAESKVPDDDAKPKSGTIADTLLHLADAVKWAFKAPPTLKREVSKERDPNAEMGTSLLASEWSEYLFDMEKPMVRVAREDLRVRLNASVFPKLLNDLGLGVLTGRIGVSAWTPDAGYPHEGILADTALSPPLRVLKPDCSWLLIELNVLWETEFGVLDGRMTTGRAYDKNTLLAEALTIGLKRRGFVFSAMAIAELANGDFMSLEDNRKIAFPFKEGDFDGTVSMKGHHLKTFFRSDHGTLVFSVSVQTSSLEIELQSADPKSGGNWQNLRDTLLTRLQESPRGVFLQALMSHGFIEENHWRLLLNPVETAFKANVIHWSLKAANS